MKQSLKISSFIIFAATVASAFTSCGNESELFDEPVMYQTRAMTRASMRSEPEDLVNRIVERDDSRSITKDVIVNKLEVTVTLWWHGGTRLGSTELFSKCEVKSKDPNCWATDTILIGEGAYFDGTKPTVIYSFTVHQRFYHAYKERMDTLHYPYTETFQGDPVELF